MSAAALPADLPAAVSASRWDRWRIRALAALVALNGVQYVLMLAGIPEFYRRIVTHSVPSVAIGAEVMMSQGIIDQEIAVRGLTPGSYAIYFLVTQLIIATGFWAAGSLVLSQAGGHWFRWLTALFLIFYPSGQLWAITEISQVAYDVLILNGLLWPIFLLFFYLFPDGRAVPRWGRWVMGAFVLVHMVVQFVGFLAEARWLTFDPPPGFENLFGIILFGLTFALLSQIYRYWRVAGPVERKQMQWFVLALLVFVLGNVIYSLVTGDDEWSSADGYSYDVSLFIELFIPIAITISILRYRLWDIDVIIRRTLVYAVISGLLALVYFGSVVVLEGVLRGATGSGSQVAIVLSTLLIAALFGPVRARVQRAIDRRFYRRKYDAGRTLAAFGASVRDNTDLESLGQRLTAVVDETMQPAQVGLWVRAAERRPDSGARQP